ncbi:hypothetical protein [Spirillospora albida]|uniref:hypothetical protein n=1 Tax=Spirillospora albida TaxID=58123 RepID=UPI0004C18281|nr:hypothetical protein [Spirillospora albida]
MSPNLSRELRAVRKEAVSQGWTVLRGKRYWKLRCPCPMKHKKSMSLTPSNPNYVKNLLGELRRATCWKG